VTLVAFLATNAVAFGHGQLPFCSSCQCCEAEKAEGEKDGKEPTSDTGCKRCSAKKNAQTPETTSKAPVKNGERGDSPEPSCPCQHKDKPSCPCPGGCIYCNIAKTLCHLSSAVSPISSDCMIEQTVEAPVVYLSLLCGELFRPPRI